MAKTPSRLGKGLSAILGTGDNENTENESDSFQLISLDDIRMDKNQPRKHFDFDALSQLANSIKNFGVLQPILVRKEGSAFIIIAGERRFRACKQLSLSKIPAIITASDESASLEKALIENFHREDLNSIELASALDLIISTLNYTQESLATKIGISRSALTNYLRLLQLPDIIQDALKKNEISQSLARTLLSAEKEEFILSAFDFVKKEKPSIVSLEKFIKTQREKQNKAKQSTSAQTIEKETKYIEDAFYKHLGTRVTLSPTFEKGTIQIQYFSKKDLERILELLQIPLL